MQKSRLAKIVDNFFKRTMTLVNWVSNVLQKKFGIVMNSDKNILASLWIQLQPRKQLHVDNSMQMEKLWAYG